MIIIEDTRQQKEKHELKHEWFSGNAVDLIRCKLPFGDYALPPSLAIDTKKDMEEIAGNICGTKAEHNRFKREVLAAKNAGCKLVFLVENMNGITSIDEVHTWINPRVVYYPGCVQGDRLEKAMKTMRSRYGCEFLFCAPEESGEIISKLLGKEYEQRNAGSS